MRSIGAVEDTHFYIDNAPPKEVAWVLRALDGDLSLSPQMIAERLYVDFGYRMQGDKTYSPRRLFDLGLAQQTKVQNQVLYSLTDLGRKMAQVEQLDSDFYNDLVHFLHFSRYKTEQSSRKYLWSYYQCSEITWMEKRLVPRQELASRIQELMRDEFSYLDFGARQGVRFDSTAAGRFYSWVRELSPSPFLDDKDNGLCPRIAQHYELALLALDYVYRVRGYRYGDPVILDDVLLDELARVFFLDHQCYRNLLTLAAKVTRRAVLTDTFAGTSVNLLSPYTVDTI